MEKINIAELLRNCPKGMELDCAEYDGIVKFDGFNENNPYIIRISVMYDGEITIHNLTKYGQTSVCSYNKCVIFPKGKNTWEGFQRPFKDGDIVTWEDRGSLVAFIYKERKDVAVVKHHFALYTGSLGIVTTGEISLVESEIVFATEEEKQKLFDAIKENGYKWNAETKTLEKLPKFKVGDRIKDKNNKIWFVVQVSEKHFDISSVPNTEGYFVSIDDQDYYELVPNKFDITTLKTYDKVLYRMHDKDTWCNSFYCFYKSNHHFVTSLTIVRQCIPYEGNEHLLGTTNKCDEFYETWEFISKKEKY